MSFSKEVKKELSKQVSLARHCQIAEIAAIFSLAGRISINIQDKYAIYLHTENIIVARRYCYLIRKAFQVKPHVQVRRNSNTSRSKTYSIIIKDHETSILILKATKIMDEYGDIAADLSLQSNLVFQNSCCKRAFIRGAYITSGSMSDPEKTYHFEIVVSAEEKAIQLKEILDTFSIDAKIVLRKKNYVVYIKEGSQIVDILNVMEAHVSLMNLENVRIIKDMRNSINRQVNCETANINKTVIAATKQIDDIIYIRDHVGFSELSEGLEEMAMLRIEHPDASLKELGTLISPPIGKSGVNHRLRKLSIIADHYREQKEDISYGNKENNN